MSAPYAIRQTITARPPIYDFQREPEVTIGLKALGSDKLFVDASQALQIPTSQASNLHAWPQNAGLPGMVTRNTASCFLLCVHVGLGPYLCGCLGLLIEFSVWLQSLEFHLLVWDSFLGLMICSSSSSSAPSSWNPMNDRRANVQVFQPRITDSEPPGPRSTALDAYVSQRDVLVAWPYALGALALRFRWYGCFKPSVSVLRLGFLTCRAM